jgi:pyrimidine operon attenuation protein/uracil phosphoribosyltransferase
VLIGIQRRGVPLAAMIKEAIESTEKTNVPFGVLDITFYRDDLSLLSEHPTVNRTSIEVPIDDKNVVLVDDVLFTGRTVRAGIDALLDFGRPKTIQLAVLIDRGHREFPIKADYVGKNVPTSKTEVIKVKMQEYDGRNAVVIAEQS